jgi:hypothetical protein
VNDAFILYIIEIENHRSFKLIAKLNCFFSLRSISVLADYLKKQLPERFGTTKRIEIGSPSL